MKYLNKEELVGINKNVLKNADSDLFGIQYAQGLDIIVEQPGQVVFGRELYPTIWLKSAFIIQKITKKHIFIDGNKRTALIAGLTFLAINGYDLSFTAEEGEKLMLAVPRTEDTEDTMLALAEWLKAHSIK